MNNHLKIAAVSAFLLALAGRGQALGQAPAQTPAEAFQVKHRSVFTSADGHNPFWPIGWAKTADASQQEIPQAVVPISSANFTVTSISISATPLAVINGKTYAEGELISAVYGGQNVKIRVISIDDGKVVLQYNGKNYPVEMKHPELAHKAAAAETPVDQQDRPMILR